VIVPSVLVVVRPAAELRPVQFDLPHSVRSLPWPVTDVTDGPIYPVTPVIRV